MTKMPKRAAIVRTPPLLEKQIQRTVCDFLRAESWDVYEFEQTWSEKKHKTVGQAGMPDVLAIRYMYPHPSWEVLVRAKAQVLWLELKRIDRRGRTTKASQVQLDWHAAKRAMGALTWIAGVDFPATIDGFPEHYKRSGLARKVE